MISSLPMYATPLTAGADARFWSLIRDNLRSRGFDAPQKLTVPPPNLMGHWRDPALVFSQTCGLPFRATLKDEVSLIGTPDYGIEDCPAGYYRSLVIARADDPHETLSDYRHTRFAYNDPMSQSGWAALSMEMPDILQGPRLCTGSHRASVFSVQQGKADFAAVDAVTWRHLQMAGEATGLRIIHATRPTPGLPFITAKSGPADALFSAVSQAIASLTNADRETLHLRALITLPPDAYELPLPPTPDAI